MPTGPTGSVKSTTQEDPIEYIHKYKKSMNTQREIGHDSRSFAGGLRAALRQDPDVILVGVISQRLIPRSSGQGRIVAAEILLCNHAVRNLIREGKLHQIPSLIQLSTKQKMQTLDKHLQMLYAAGKITKEEAFAYCKDEPAMELFMKSATKDIGSNQ